MTAVMDTIIIEPDERHFVVLWRASRLLQENMFELVQCVVGGGSRAEEDVV